MAKTICCCHKPGKKLIRFIMSLLRICCPLLAINKTVVFTLKMVQFQSWSFLLVVMSLKKSVNKLHVHFCIFIHIGLNLKKNQLFYIYFHDVTLYTSACVRAECVL